MAGSDLKVRNVGGTNGASPDPETSSHILVKSLYAPADLKGFDYESEIGYPGEYPFTRGVQPTMYRGRLWTMRSTRAWAMPRNRISATNICWRMGRPGFRWRSICQRKLGWIRTRAGGGRSRQGGSGDRLDRRYGTAICWDRADKDFYIDDHQCDGIDSTGALCGGGAAAGWRHPEAFGDSADDVLKEYIARGTYIYPPRYPCG